MKCGECEYDTDTINRASSVEAQQMLMGWHKEEGCSDEESGGQTHVETDQDVVRIPPEDMHTQAEVNGQEGGCQLGQFTCLGQTPSFVNYHSYCELCSGHFRGCWDKFGQCQGEMCDGLGVAQGDRCSRCSRWMFACGRCETEKQQQLESHYEDKHVVHMYEVQLVEVSGDIPLHLQGGADLGAGLDQAGPGIARDNAELGVVLVDTKLGAQQGQTGLEVAQGDALSGLGQGAEVAGSKRAPDDAC